MSWPLWCTAPLQYRFTMSNFSVHVSPKIKLKKDYFITVFSICRIAGQIINCPTKIQLKI